MQNLHLVGFHNRHNPHAGFDMLALEDLFLRTNLDPPPDQLHLVEFYMIVLVKEGTGRHTVDFTDFPCQRGTVLTIGQHQIHKFFKDPDKKGYMLLFTDDFLVHYLGQSELNRSLQLFNEALALPHLQLPEEEFVEVVALVQRIQREYLQVNDAFSLGVIRSELQILIARLLRIKAQSFPQTTQNTYLDQFLVLQALVDAHVVETRQVKDYAAMMGVSSKTVNNIARAVVNQSAKAFVASVAVTKIKRLLLNTSLSVKEIAYQSGFEDPSNLYKFFRREAGNTPEQFRANKS